MKEQNNFDFIIDDALSEVNSDNQNSNQEFYFKPKKKKGRVKKILFWILIVFLVLILSGIITVFALIQNGKKSLLNTESMQMDFGSALSDVEIDDDGKTIIRNGKKYIYNENMTTALCIGVDKEHINNTTGTNNANGQADALFIYAMDTSTGKSTIIPISRDTMVEVDTYSASGGFISSEQKQLCLAFSYGNGKETSCENTIKSVSRLFGGLPINSYVAIDMKAIEVLSKKIGGVTVVPESDFEYNGYKFKKDVPVTLQGTEAKMYIQGRDTKKTDSNSERMARQKQFLTAYFENIIKKTKEDISFPVSVYKDTTKYMVTNIGVSEVSFFATCVLKSGGSLEYRNINGNTVLGEKYAEYHPDYESIYQTVIDVFYKPAV